MLKIIRHEIGRLASRFDEVRCYFSTGSCELIETVSSHAVKEIFALLSSIDEETFTAKIAEIGSQSTANLKTS